MQIDYRSDGIFLPEINLALDASGRCDCTWISHAHSDHARGLHCRVIATPLTLEAYRLRWPEDPDSPQEMVALDYGASYELNGARLTCYPASHIIGAAQLLIEYLGERIVYTGDIKLRGSICGVNTEMPPCDRLIIESTFGLPVFQFITADEARARIVATARECLADGTTPVFVGYPLGRGQEIVHVLTNAGIPTAVHGSIARFIPVYESAGYQFPGWEPYAAKQTAGRALVVVHNFRAVLEASGKNIRGAYVSGWAALDNARARASVEELIPYSDHAGFDELLELVERSGAREVDVVHGYTDTFARILAQRGIAANAPRAAAAREPEEMAEA